VLDTLYSYLAPRSVHAAGVWRRTPLYPYALKPGASWTGWRDRARRAMPSSNDELTPSAERPPGRPAAGSDRPTVDVVILGGSEETRLLLRGLLRLHRHRVDREVRSAEGLDVREGDVGPPRVLILVADTESDDWARELIIARDRQGGLLPLLIVPDTSSELIARAKAAGVRGILSRPFAVRDLVRAVETVAAGGELFPGAGDSPTGRGQR
jgi:hypothetical protein